MRYYTNVQCLGNSIVYREINDGVRVKKRVSYSPSFFIPSPTKTEYTTLHNKYVKKLKFDNIRSSRDFLNQYKNCENFEFFGNSRFEYTYISDNYDKSVEYDFSKLLIANVDIETGSENGFPHADTALEPIISITMKLKGAFYVFGCGEYKEHTKDISIKYFKCKNEYDLIEKFLKLWDHFQPDIITGWNITFFDIPYLVNRITKLKGEEASLRLSPWRKIKTRQTKVMGREHTVYDLVGVSVLDYIELYKKFAPTPNQESYALSHICHVELGEEKLSYEEYGSLHTLYKRNYQKFIEYNIKDVELVDSLDDKMQLISMVVGVAYDAKVNYHDVFSQVRMWDTIFYNALKDINQVIPQTKRFNERPKGYKGAYVKEPMVGMHNWVTSLDLTSLYPHLIMEFNISPETLVQDDKRDVTVDGLVNQEFDLSDLVNDNRTVAANGHYFRTDKEGFLPKLLSKMYTQRKKAKTLMLKYEQELESLDSKDINKKRELEFLISKYNNLQLAKKVQLNSAYGALGNAYFRFYDVRQAEGITLSGQLAIKWIERYINQYLNKVIGSDNVDYVIAIDTDSVYLTLDKLVQKVYKGNIPETIKVIDFLDEFTSKALQKHIDESYQKLADYTNAFSQKMFMKREVLADKGVWTAKKRYMLNVYDNEGVRYTEPHLKIMGIETQKSSTPMICRAKMKELIKLIMDGTEQSVMDFISAFHQEFKNLPPEDIASPRGCNNLKKYTCIQQIYRKSTPIHVKGSLIYNHMLKEHDLIKKYKEIYEGDKIKYIYLKEPNRAKNLVISFPESLPEEFNLKQSIDYNKQFDKTFLDPVKAILDSIGWKHKKQSTLGRFLK